MTLTEANALLDSLKVRGPHMQLREAFPGSTAPFIAIMHDGLEARQCQRPGCPAVFFVARGKKDIRDCGAHPDA